MSDTDPIQNQNTHPDETNETTENQSASESFGESEQIAPEPETLGGTKPEPAESASKNPSDWVTGDEPATGPQKSYLDTLAREAGEEISADLTKAEASEHIDRLQQKTGRGA